jgi:hypothetical protein
MSLLKATDDKISVIDSGGGGRRGEEGVVSVDAAVVATAATTDFKTKTGALQHEL